MTRGTLAETHSHLTLWQDLAGFPLQVIFSGRYHDPLECVDGCWRFTSRWAIGDMSPTSAVRCRPGPCEVGAEAR